LGKTESRKTKKNGTFRDREDWCVKLLFFRLGGGVRFTKEGQGDVRPNDRQRQSFDNTSRPGKKNGGRVCGSKREEQQVRGGTKGVKKLRKGERGSLKQNCGRGGPRRCEAKTSGERQYRRRERMVKGTKGAEGRVGTKKGANEFDTETQ